MRNRQRGEDLKKWSHTSSAGFCLNVVTEAKPLTISHESNIVLNATAELVPGF